MNIGVKYNNENIFTRAIIAGVLNLLNNGMSYSQYHCDGTVDNVDVPWYYNMSGDERFMQDFFTHYDYCLNSRKPKPVSGNFDQIPRGVITYNGSSIAQDALTSRFVKGNFYKEINGKLESYTSYLFSIPLSIKFTCDMWLDNFTNALRIEEMIRETFYKTQTIYVYYRGLRIGAQVGFPESVTLTKNTSYSFESERNVVKISFELEVESYQPCFDNTVEYPTGKTIREIGLRLVDKDELEDREIFFFTSPSKNLQTIYSGFNFMIEWNYKHDNAMIQRVDLSYVYDGDEYIIAKGIPNHMLYTWSVPYIDDTPKFNIMYDYNGKIYDAPSIKVIPNGNKLDTNSFVILSEGSFSNSTPNDVNIIIEYINKDGNVSYTNEGDIILHLNDGVAHSVSVKDKLTLNIVDESPKKEIKLRVYNSLNHKMFCESNTIEII